MFYDTSSQQNTAKALTVGRDAVDNVRLVRRDHVVMESQ